MADKEKQTSQGANHYAGLGWRYQVYTGRGVEMPKFSAPWHWLAQRDRQDEAAIGRQSSKEKQMHISFDENHRPTLIGAPPGVTLQQCSIVFDNIGGDLVVGSGHAEVMLDVHGRGRRQSLPLVFRKVGPVVEGKT